MYRCTECQSIDVYQRVTAWAPQGEVNHPDMSQFLEGTRDWYCNNCGHETVEDITKLHAANVVIVRDWLQDQDIEPSQSLAYIDARSPLQLHEDFVDQGLELPFPTTDDDWLSEIFSEAATIAYDGLKLEMDAARADRK